MGRETRAGMGMREGSGSLGEGLKRGVVLRRGRTGAKHRFSRKGEGGGWMHGRRRLGEGGGVPVEEGCGRRLQESRPL